MRTPGASMRRVEGRKKPNDLNVLNDYDRFNPFRP
jgi:hypothetical protein